MAEQRVSLNGNVYELVEFFDHDSQQYLLALKFVYCKP